MTRYGVMRILLANVLARLNSCQKVSSDVYRAWIHTTRTETKKRASYAQGDTNE